MNLHRDQGSSLLDDNFFLIAYLSPISSLYLIGNHANSIGFHMKTPLVSHPTHMHSTL
jgi:hypothetical protein